MSAVIYVTGVPGAGKSTVRGELRRLGKAVLGVDEDHIGAFHTVSGQIIEARDAIDDPLWRRRHEWRIVADRHDAILEAKQPVTVYLCGSAANEGDVWPRFTTVVALLIDNDTLRQRLATRTGNNFGKSEDELALALSWNENYESAMLRCGALVVDATGPVAAVVEELISLTT
jgi:broad-specificity NMP kinase